jgi:ribosomal protein S18 acetylase RimI-like enzyme
MIRKLTSNEAEISAKIHILGLPDDFLASLGYEFLVQLHYLFIIAPSVIPLGYFKNKKLIGMIICSLNTKKTYQEILLKGFIKLLPHVIKQLFLHPVIIRVVLQALFYPNRQTTTENLPEILVMSVDHNNQRQGIGSNLMSRLKSDLHSLNYNKIRVSTKKVNLKANKFYQKNGGVFQRSYLIFNSLWNEYLFSI